MNEQERLINAIRNKIDYWQGVDTTERKKLEGLACSILFILDGCAGETLGYAVVPIGEDSDATEGDIAGGLHELFGRVETTEGK